LIHRFLYSPYPILQFYPIYIRLIYTKMKYALSLAAAALYATGALAFPANMFDISMNEEEKRNLATLAAQIEAGVQKRAGTPLAPGFSASQQYVSNKDDHAFVAPNFAAGDQRGPCPGLNAMANHGYLPHNGVATITQFVQATYDGKCLPRRGLNTTVANVGYSLWYGP
jgi:hypothetical protein